MKTRDGRTSRLLAGRTRMTALLLLAAASQAGCGREFYREWANQDASEAVFEKSRDPRWRIDLFSVDPPALSRFSDPYDPDRPPAPPDDYATQSLSPVPQLADNRLLVPLEGTGYLDMLEAWKRDHPVNPSGMNTTTGTVASPPAAPVATPRPPDPATPSPFKPETQPATGANSGTDGGVMTPNSLPGSATPTPPGSNLPPSASQAPNRAQDLGVTLTAFQQTGLPLPVPNMGPSTPRTTPPPRDIQPPPLGMEPQPGDINDLSKPIQPPPGQSPEQFRAGEALASQLAGILVPKSIDFNEAEAAGLPRGSKPYVISMNQAFTLALINSRVYQTNLETIYGAALAVTLQRFTFTPQFYAGMSPNASVVGSGVPSPNPANSFLYSTRATGSQVSALNMGTVAGVGKVFASGGRIITGFANQLVFNFVGKNSFQPTVKSYLPLTLVQPFLRGGGRAVTLELLTQAERNLVYQIRSFAKFRQEFMVATVVGGTIPNIGAGFNLPGFSGGGNADPTTGFLNVVEDVQLMENAQSNIAAYEQIVKVYAELIKGESSGLSQLQLDQADSSLQGAKQTFLGTRNAYRTDLDQFKNQMGLPTDVPLMVNRSLTAPFKAVYSAIDRWQEKPNRELTELPDIVNRLPKLEDIILDGRSILGVYRAGKNDEDELEDILLAAERVALEHRLDLMNSRAQLYDSWRQIKVSANALQGVFTVSLSNQLITPPNNTNPFGFVDQAKQFSLAINAELPLVRLAERNTFRANLINYQRARRTLQNAEDTLKLNIRNDVRLLQLLYLQYEIARKNFVLNIRVRDQAFEQIVAPPAPGAAAQGAVQTNNLLGAQNGLLGSKNNLVTTWYNYQVARLSLYRDLGTLPFDEWEAFYELFPSEYNGDAAFSAARDPGITRASTTGIAAETPKEATLRR